MWCNVLVILFVLHVSRVSAFPPRFDPRPYAPHAPLAQERALNESHSNLVVDLRYSIYEGYFDGSTKLNTWNGYDTLTPRLGGSGHSRLFSNKLLSKMLLLVTQVKLNLDVRSESLQLRHLLIDGHLGIDRRVKDCAKVQAVPASPFACLRTDGRDLTR